MDKDDETHESCREESDFLQFMKIKKYLHEILLIEQDYFRDLFLVKPLGRQKYDTARVAAPGQCGTL